jgi:hypothetical protein
VYRAGSRVALEIDHPTVHIRKELLDGRTVTTIRSGRDEIVVGLERSAFVVEGPRGRIEATPKHPERVQQVKAVIAASPAAARAAALIGQLSLAPESPVRHTLLATRAVLLSAAGDETGAGEIARSIRGLRDIRGAVGVARIDDDQFTAAQCWALYAAEAILAYLEYEGCMNGEEWWDVLGMISCAFVYDVRAIGAFAWWLSCVGLLGA